MTINKFVKSGILVLLASTMVFSCKKDPVINDDDGNNGNGDTTTMVEMTPFELVAPKHFPPVEIPENNQLYVERINLGKKLFFDTRLSNDGSACADCHKPEYGFSFEGVSQPDKGLTSLPLINLAWHNMFMWNGRITGSLEEVMGFELRDRFNTDITKINDIDEYKVMFKNFYGVNDIKREDLQKALAQYMRVLVSRDTKYDRYFSGMATLTPSEERGRAIFFTEKGDCFHCHTNVIFTDGMLRNNGLDSLYAKDIDLGHYNVTQNPEDKGKFRTPNLRNVALRTHFMHDGRFTTLEEVVDFYNTDVKQVSNVDPVMTKDNRQNGLGLGLDAVQKQDLVAFLKTLTDSTMINDPLFKAP